MRNTACKKAWKLSIILFRTRMQQLSVRDRNKSPWWISRCTMCTLKAGLCLVLHSILPFSWFNAWNLTISCLSWIYSLFWSLKLQGWIVLAYICPFYETGFTPDTVVYKESTCVSLVWRYPTIPPWQCWYLWKYLMKFLLSYQDRWLLIHFSLSFDWVLLVGVLGTFPIHRHKEMNSSGK